MSAVERSMHTDAAAGDRMERWFRGGLILVLIELGRRTGVLDRMGDETWRTDALARAADVDRRYLLEWLSAMTAFGLVRLASDDGDGEERWSLSSELVPYLTPDAMGSTRVPLATAVVGAAHQMARLVEPFRNGGGLSYAECDPNLSASFDYDARVNYGRGLIKNILPTVPGLEQRLHDGVAVADLGCGRAYGLEILAAIFPHSRFVGFDPNEDVIRAGRQRLKERNIVNVELRAQAIEDIPVAADYEVACAFEVIHNLPDPSAALTRAREVLAPGGMFFMYETNASSSRAQNMELPWAGQIYTASLLSCLTVSLAHDGVGYGAMWGIETAERLMDGAGFEGIGHREVIDDPMHVIIWGRRRGS